jgi:uncharacterized protein YaaW (UPF0174 family)
MADEIFKMALDGGAIEEVEPLATLLEVPLPKKAKSGLLGANEKELLWKELSYFGSNDLAYVLRGFEGVDYAEIVRDVCEKKKIKDIKQSNRLTSVRKNEEALLEALFTDIWNHMSEAEKHLLLKELDLNEMDFLTGGTLSAGARLAAHLAGAGGFGTYRMAVIVANTVARALLGRGITFAGNAAITRALGVALGPIGWIASGAWLVLDLAAPAYRKTVPAVVQVAALRQLTEQRELIGVMGHGSTGKDSLLKHVFEIDTKEIHPIPGATKAVKLYNAPTTATPLRVMNFPGFGDLHPEVEEEIREQASNCKAIIYLFNGAEIPKREEIEEFERYAKDVHGKSDHLIPVIPLLNKWDKADDDEREAIISETRRRLGRDDFVCTSFKDKAGNPYFKPSIEEVRQKINEWARDKGKHAPFSEAAA